MNFDHIILEEEQKELFARITETVKSVPREKRHPFIEASSKDGNCLIVPSNDRSKSNITDFASGDLDVLTEAGRR